MTDGARDADDWFAEMDRLGANSLLPEARERLETLARAVKLT